MKITLNEVRRFQHLANLTESQVERQLLATKPGDKVELTLDDDTKQMHVRVGTNSQNEPTFKMLKNDKPVSRESALAVSFIKAVKPIVTRQLTGDPDADFMGEAKATQTGSPLDGGVGYDRYQIEVDIDTFRIIQGKNIIEISRKASKELAKEIRDSFF